MQQSLLPDVAVSYFNNKNAMIATRTAWNGQNWWQEYPELVKLAKDHIPIGWKLYKPGKYAVGTLTGIESSILTGEIYEKI